MPTRANGQPAFGYYLRDPVSPAITRFGDNSLFPLFGLPRTLRE